MSSLAALAFAALAFAQAAMTEAGREIAAAEAERLSACIELIETDPEAAYEDALAWLMAGNRPPARQCAALALIELGHVEEGAARLEALANAPDAGGLEARARFLGQAGNAWLLAGFPEAAVTALSNAIKIEEDNASLYADRAAARLALEQWRPALGDLDTALAADPGDPDALALRARALLALERYDEALADIEAARLAVPEDIDLLVLRGEIREAKRLAE